MIRLPVFLPVILLVTSLSAQTTDTLPKGAVAERSVAASPSLAACRSIGDSRAWVFYSRQTTFGHLTSVVVGKRDVDGNEALTLKETLQVDFTKLGQENRILFEGETWVLPRGYFAGCDFQIGPRDSIEQMTFTPAGNRLTGFYTRLGSRYDVELPWRAETFAWDPFLFDQLELYLALKDLKIGTVLDDSLFQPQTMTYAHIRGQVSWFMWQEIYKGKLDSVFVINLSEPAQYQLMFTADKRLVKVDIKDLQIRVYQDVVRQVQSPAAESTAPATPLSPPFSLRLLILKLPHYLAYLVIAALILLILAVRAFRWRVSYLALGLGVVLYLIMPWVIFPLMLVVARDWLQLGAPTGTAFYVRGGIFSLIYGILQAGLLLAGILSTLRFTNTPRYRAVGLAAFLAAGFALADSAYLAGFRVAILFDWPLLERACMIALNIAAGALIGRFLKEDWPLAAWATLGGSVGLAVARFFPMLVQGRVVDLQLMHFILAIWTAVVLVVVLIFSGRSYGKTVEELPAEEPADQEEELQS